MGRDGVRVNAISAGPIKTLAASGVKNFRKMLSQHSARAPLRKNSNYRRSWEMLQHFSARIMQAELLEKLPM